MPESLLLESMEPRPLRLLVVDDHPAIRAGIRGRMEQETGRAIEVVGVAGDGEAAVELLRELLPDVAIVDVRMPRLDGFGVLRRVRGEGIATHVVLLSALIHRQVAQRAFEEGARGIDAGEPGLRSRISEREAEVLQLAAAGLANRRIAEQLGLGEETVKTRLANVMRKLGVGSRTEAIAAALRGAIIS